MPLKFSMGKLGDIIQTLTIIAKSDPVTRAIYARENNLLQIKGWEKLARIENRQKRIKLN